MATRTWSGSLSTDWFTAGNWDTGVPGSGDDVIVSTTGNSPALGASTTVNTITFNGSDTLDLSGAATVVTVTNGITLGAAGGISGLGAVASAINASGAAHITAAGGTLELTGPITDNGGALVLTIAGAADKLLLDGTSAAQTVTFGSTGTLELNSTTTLTLSAPMALGSGTVKLDPLSTLIAPNNMGLTISDGTIVGTGSVQAPISTSGAAHITASGGTLQVGGISGGSAVLIVAGATDRLLVTTATAQTVSFGSTGTLELFGSVGFNSAVPVDAGTLKLDGAALAAQGAVTISTGTITGFGKVDATVTASGSARIATDNSGLKLEVTGPIADQGDALELVANTGSTILIDAFSTVHQVTFSGGIIELNTAGALTVGTPMAISDRLQLDGPASTLTDAGGVTLTNGLITGQGTFNASLSGTGGTVRASGGTLHMLGTVASGSKFSIDDVTGSVLSIENNATASDPITIDTSNKTLSIGSSGNLTINGGAESIANGAIKISAGGQLSDSSGFNIGSGGLLIGAGKVAGAITGTGVIEASGGTLELVTAVPASGTTFAIANSLLATLLLDTAPSSGNTFTFLGAKGALALGDDTGFNNTISGLNVAAAGAKTSFVNIRGHSVTISNVSGQGTTSGMITLSDGAVLNLTNLSSSSWFANEVDDGAGGTDIFVSGPVCFCRGTLIRTERGEVPVEQLAVGERVITLSGEAKPIVWIGMGRETVTRANKLARPVIVYRGALADGVPARDLYLTHGHALYFDSADGGALIPVENLVNHRSILWDERAETVVFYHVELADHDVLVANGAPAESYYDARNRALFDTTRPGSLPANAVPEFAPVISGGAMVERVWRALLERAGGRVESGATDDPDLHLVIDGARLDPATVEDFAYGFALAAPPAGGLCLRSRTGVPSLLGVTAHDHRRLGCAISRIVIAQKGIATTLSHDAPLFLAGGCHPPEQGYSWTDGEFELPARLFAHFRGPLTVTVHTERPGGMRYPLSPTVANAA